MSSSRRLDANETPLTNVRIKVEPGTAATATSPLLKNIKTEPGVPVPAASTTTTTRLTSFRVPRDLTLGGNVKNEKAKKIYTPNVNVRRNKKQEDGTSSKNESKRGRGKSRGRGNADRGRGRGKGSDTLIQSTGVFSQGISESSRSGVRSYAEYRDARDDRRDARTVVERPLLNLNPIVDKAEEEEKLKALLRDDFIDDGTRVIPDDAPVVLPLIERGKLYKNEPKTETELEPSEQEQVDVKPVILANGSAVMPNEEPKVKTVGVKREDTSDNGTIPEIIENQNNGYILIQFPDCLPGLSSKGQNERNPPAASDDASKSEYCTLESLKAGMLGKIVIHGSGKARLLVGDNSMVIDVGSRLSFRQDLVAGKIDADNSNGRLVNLGRVNDTLVCSPDWETMLASL